MWDVNQVSLVKMTLRSAGLARHSAGNLSGSPHDQTVILVKLIMLLVCVMCNVYVFAVVLESFCLRIRISREKSVLGYVL